MKIRTAVTDDDVRSCFAVMRQLRPHFDEAGFLEQVRRQEGQGFSLVMGVVDGRVVAAAGYRLAENLACGRFLYVDDLVTDAACRSRGHGRRLLAWLRELAREAGCAQLHLDSGVQRADAHRFYAREGLNHTGLHFAQALLPGSPRA